MSKVWIHKQTRIGGSWWNPKYKKEYFEVELLARNFRSSPMGAVRYPVYLVKFEDGHVEETTEIFD